MQHSQLFIAISAHLNCELSGLNGERLICNIIRIHSTHRTLRVTYISLLICIWATHRFVMSIALPKRREKKKKHIAKVRTAVIVSMFRAILFESEYECFDNLPLLQFFFKTRFSFQWELEASNICRNNCNTYDWFGHSTAKTEIKLEKRLKALAKYPDDAPSMGGKFFARIKTSFLNLCYTKRFHLSKATL